MDPVQEQQGRRPTATEENLLVAALGPPDAARVGWRNFSRDAGLNGAAAELQRLAPLLRPRIDDLGITGADRKAIERFSRATWAKNQRLLNAGGGAITLLREAGISALVLKGAALLATSDTTTAERWMADFDLLVPYDRRIEAIEHLDAHGWHPVSEPDYRADKHGIETVDEHGLEIDVHWHVSSYFVRLGGESTVDDDFWASAQPIDLAGVDALALCPADQLLHVIVHGNSWGAGNRFQWIADASSVIGADPDLDWDRLVSQAITRSCAAPVAGALEYLRDLLATPIPPHVVAGLRAAKSSPQARLAWWLDERSPPHNKSLKVVRRALSQYLYLTADMTPAGAVSALPAVLSDRTGLNGHDLMTELGRRVGRLVRR